MEQKNGNLSMASMGRLTSKEVTILPSVQRNHDPQQDIPALSSPPTPIEMLDSMHEMPEPAPVANAPANIKVINEAEISIEGC